jgi:hypothetical protein
MSTPSIIVGRGNWGVKATRLLGYSLVDSLYLPREFTCSRAGNTATRVNQNGNIEVVNADVPRIDHFGGQAALLVEPSAENLALQSQAFDVSGTWAPSPGGTGSSPSVTANAVISPDGTQNAETVLLNRGAGNLIGDQSTLSQNITLATSGTYTFSVYAKATSSADIGKQVFLRAGSAGSLIAYTLTANWVRLIRTEAAIANGSNVFQIGSRGTVTADNSVSVDLWGAQVEAGSVATSYIPTTTGAVTRNDDVINLTGATNYIGQTEGTIYLELEFRDVAAAQLIFLDVGGSSQYIRITKNATNAINVLVLNTSGSQSLFTSSSNPVGIYKLALAYKSGDNAMSINGATPLTSANTSNYPTSSLSRVVLSDSMVGFKPLNGRIRAAEIYPTRLPNVAPPGVLSLQSLTAI